MGALPLDPTGGTAAIPPLWSSSCFYFDITKRNLLRLAELWPILEVCMGMGKTGIPRVPWDSHGNGSKISHGNGSKAWELSPATVNSLLFVHSNME